jgi:hypothetical protein
MGFQNIVAACNACNGQKADMTHLEFYIWIDQNRDWIKQGILYRREHGIAIPKKLAAPRIERALLTSRSLDFQTPFTNAAS